MNLQGGEEILSLGRDPLKTMCNRLSKFKYRLVVRPAQRPILARGPSSPEQQAPNLPILTSLAAPGRLEPRGVDLRG